MPRNDNSIGRQAMQAFIDQEQRTVDFYRNALGKCTSCTDFKQGFCALYQQPVPADVQPTGCAEWEFDFVPF